MFLNKHLVYMKKALNEAKKAYLKKEVPIGAVLIYNNTILASAYNKKEKSKDITSHAEIEVIRKGSKKLGTYHLNSCIIYVTMEPCPMCLSAIIQSGIKKIIYAVKDKKMGAIESCMNYFEFPNGKKLSVISGILEQESKKILQKFFKKLR